MSKLELTKTQLEDIANKSMLVLPIIYDYEDDDYNDKYNFGATINELHNGLPKGLTNCENYGMSFGCDVDCPTFRKGKCELQYLDNVNLTISEYCPVQKGDKDVWIAEEFFYVEQTKEYLFKDMFFNGKITLNETYDINDFNWQPASQMTKEQSRHTISEILDVRVVRVQDIDIYIAEDLGIDIVNAVDSKELEELERTNSNPSHLPMYAECPLVDIRERIKKYYNQIIKEHKIDRTYEDNDYVFLVEYKY